MKSQVKVVLNYNVLLKELAEYQNLEGYDNLDVKKISKIYGVEIKKTWGSKTTFHGFMLEEKELQKILNYCKQCPDVKYLFFDYPKRFAYGATEFTRRYLLFKELGVEVFFLHTKMPDVQSFMATTVKKLKEANHE